VLRPCCTEWLAGIGNLLILLEVRSNASQHETKPKNEAETARNPLTAGISGGEG
jgi:hypothetical protein